MAEALNADINFKSSIPTNSSKTVTNIGISKSVLDQMTSVGPQTKFDKGKKVVYKVKEIRRPKENKGITSFSSPVTSDGINSVGPSK
ncbi:hypothetical protein SLA2020_424330 [Shorea laevis]